MRAARILLVEDEGVIRMVLAEFLRNAGYAVVEAYDGDVAARLLADDAGYDALLTVVRMPGALDGIDVAMLARLRRPGLPVLVMSGYAPQLVKRLAELRPAAVFVAKPYQMQEVVETITRMIPAREPSGE